MRLGIALVLAVPVLALQINLASVSTALAVTCQSYPGSGHWYGVAEWDDATSNQGAYVDMYTASGSAADWNNWGFISQVLWEDTYNAKLAGQVYWIEAGYTYGWEDANLFTYYWADSRPNGLGYSEHRVSSIAPSVGDWLPIQIQEVDGGSTWDVYFNNSTQTDHDGTKTISTENPGYSEGMATGLESTSDSNSMSTTHSSGLDYWDPSSGWHSTWGSGTTVWCYGPAFSGWVAGEPYHETYDGM